jgi:hypothetical protein
MNECFLDKIILEDAGMVGDSRLFRLGKEFRVKTSKGLFSAPKGFITDGASSPRWSHSIVGPFGDAFGAALVHDYLYSKDCPYNVTRKEADDIFLELLKASGVSFIKRQTIYLAVRSCGWMFWRKD